MISRIYIEIYRKCPGGVLSCVIFRGSSEMSGNSRKCPRVIENVREYSKMSRLYNIPFQKKEPPYILIIPASWQRRQLLLLVLSWAYCFSWYPCNLPVVSGLASTPPWVGYSSHAILCREDSSEMPNVLFRHAPWENLKKERKMKDKKMPKWLSTIPTMVQVWTAEKNPLFFWKTTENKPAVHTFAIVHTTWASLIFFNENKLKVETLENVKPFNLCPLINLKKQRKVNLK